MQETTSVATESASASKFAVTLSNDAMVEDDMAIMAKNTNGLSSMPIEVSATSDTTLSSSSRSRSSSSSCSSTDSSVDALNDDYGAHVLSSSEEENDDKQGVEQQDVEKDTTRHFLVKPMPSRLQVCPVDDLAVEDEKRRRRSRRNLKNKGNGKKKLPSGISRDAESFQSMPSPLVRIGSSPVLCAPLSTHCKSSGTRHHSARNSHTSTAAVVQTPPASAVPLLRKDSAAIRRQYWSQLGFSLSRSDLEKCTGRKKERRDGLKVRLNDADSKNEQRSKGFFQFITSWYTPLTVTSGEDGTLPKEKACKSNRGQLRSLLSQHSMSSIIDDSEASLPNKRVHFNEEAELFYIPLHRDYSKRQRDCMWPTRTEFIAMVERNLDAVYDEMEREYEAQVENEYLENEGMAREEDRQREIEAQQLKATETRVESRRSFSPPLSRCSSTMSLSMPTLTLSQKQVLVSPRARSSHELRFKYLKHLGINS